MPGAEKGENGSQPGGPMRTLNASQFLLVSPPDGDAARRLGCKAQLCGGSRGERSRRSEPPVETGAAAK